MKEAPTEAASTGTKQRQSNRRKAR